MTQSGWDFFPFDPLGGGSSPEQIGDSQGKLPDPQPPKVPKPFPKKGPTIEQAPRLFPVGLLANRRDEGIPRAFLLQKWITVRGTSPIVSITQQDTGWCDVATYADAAFWIEVAEVTNPFGGTVSLIIESSPTWDETAFKPVAPSIVLSASPAPYVVRCLRTQFTAPLSRWVRWRLVASTTGTWDATIRIRGTGGSSNFVVPTMIRGCWCWLRADLGVQQSGGNVTSWSDQALHAGDVNDLPNDAVSGAFPPSATGTPINGQKTISFNATGTQYMQLGLSTNNPPTSIHAFVVHRRGSDTETVAAHTGFWRNAATDGTKIPDVLPGNQIVDDAFSNAIHTCGVRVIPSLAQPHVYEVESDVSTWTNRLNGLLQFSVSHTYNFNGAGDIGGTSTGGRYYTGDWAEIVLYRRILKGAERSLLIDYFNTRYNLGAV